MSTLEELRAPAAYLFLVYASCFLLYIVVPGRRVSGYVRNARGKPLLYRLNGLRVFLLTICVTGCACYLSNTSFTLASSHRMSCCVWACLLGLVVSSLFYLKGPFEEHMSAHSVPASRDVGDFKNFRKAARIFFNGWELNPCLGLIDFKMFFYLAGATMLEINVLSGLVYHYSTFQEISWPLIVYCCEMTWFLVDYVYHEHVQLYTYDLFAENVGFKLAWGCLCFYPYFYSIGLPVLYQAKQGDVPYLYYVLIISIVVFIVGYVLSRGANNQKYKFKIDQKVKKYGFIEQRSIGGKLLVSGFWGVSRHVNYLGEILMAVGLALPGGWIGGSLLPWLYPVYYVLLLVRRERDDNVRCQQKYKYLWDKYTSQVPWRIVPYCY